MRQAARRNWGVPDALRTEALYQTQRILTDATSSPRDTLAAVRLLVEADRADAAAEESRLRAEAARNPDSATQGDGVRAGAAEKALRVLIEASETEDPGCPT